MVRITNSGYDFIGAIGQDKSYKQKFEDWLDRGLSLANAAAKVIELAGKAIGM